MEWHYVRDGQRVGPIPQADLDRLAGEGVITPETMVWRAGMANWQPYSTLGTAGAPAPVPVGAATPDDGDTAVCAVSGERHPKRDMIQYEGKWISAAHRDAFFQRLREGVPQVLEGNAVPGPFGYASFWRRFAARFVDGLIMWVVQVVLGAVVTAVFLAGSAGTTPDATRMLFVQLILMGIGIACYSTYEAVFLWKYGATPGKMAMGVKVVRADGTGLKLGRGFGRYFGQLVSSLILCIGYLMMLWDDEKRTLHDRMVDTRVIKTRR